MVAKIAWWRRCRRLWWRLWPSKGKRKLWLSLFWVPSLLTAGTILAFVLTRNPWFAILVLYTAGTWYVARKKYRELMNNPMMYLWMLEQEFSGHKPHTKEGCRLWSGNQGFCIPNEEDRCQTCNGFKKKGIFGRLSV